MTTERLARGHRAKAAWDEFLEPMFADIEAEYRDRIAEVATSELHPGIRSDKISTLSVALKVMRTLKDGMAEYIRDGELAQREKLRAEKIADLSDARQRLLKIGAGY